MKHKKEKNTSEVAPSEVSSQLKSLELKILRVALITSVLTLAKEFKELIISLIS